MPRRYICVFVLGLVVACGDDGGTGPTTSTGVSVTCPGGTIFIGNAVPCEARETFSDGSSQVATNATWGSTNPMVATISSTGLVTAVAAGQTTITADVNPQGSLQIRVFPDFNGSWAGNEVFASCEDSGEFEGICGFPGFEVGEVFSHNSSFTQNEASVDAVIVTDTAATASMTGTIGIGGLLQLPPAPSLPADPMINAEIRNWRSRADVPSHMTGSYEGFFTAPGTAGSITIRIRLENVVKTTATSVRPTSTATQQALRRVSAHLEALR